MKIQNVSPLGDLDIPLLRRVVAAGEIVDVTPEHAHILLDQPTNYEPADDEAAEVLAGKSIPPVETTQEGVAQ